MEDMNNENQNGDEQTPYTENGTERAAASGTPEPAEKPAAKINSKHKKYEAPGTNTESFLKSSSFRFGLSA